MTHSQNNIKRGTIKQIVSGDTVIIQGRPRPDGPPLERQLSFSFVTAPKLARRPAKDAKPTKDDPWAWEAREFLRKKLVGKEVFFTADKSANSTREIGCIYLGKDMSNCENLTEVLIAEGYVSVRKDAKNDDYFLNLKRLEEIAKSQGKGIHGANSKDHVREVQWTTDRDISKFHYRPIKAVIEHVRDGSTIRAFLMPDDGIYYYITLMISGIRCPGLKLDAMGKPDVTSADPLVEEARCFVESLLLQRDVEIVVESVNNNNFVGSILHPNGNIAELLLRRGYAKCVDWSLAYIKSGAATLRAAEKCAKEQRLRIWKDYQTNSPAVPIKDKEHQVVVTEIINGDALAVKMPNGTSKKIFLSSIRPPKEKTAEDNDKAPRNNKTVPFRALYDIPWMFEAREHLRKMLIGKKVHVSVDYIQPARENFSEKVCCTVMHGKINVAQDLVTQGLATVVRYRQDDDQRSAHYDELVEAEMQAQKQGVGIHSKKNIPNHKVPNISADVSLARSYLSGLQRQHRIDVVVEFVASGSRLRLYIPKDSKLITLLLGGITCPRGARPGAPGQPLQEAEPFGEEALAFTKEKVLQRDVKINVESMDKNGNFVGWLWIDDENLSVALVKAGLAQVHSTVERSSNYKDLLKSAEDFAKSEKKGLWKNYVEPVKTESKPEDDKPTERKLNLEKVVVTEVTSEGLIYCQSTEEGPKVEALMESMRKELPVAKKDEASAGYTPKKNEICAARFSVDNQWYRAKVEKVQGKNISVLFIDYGNREVVSPNNCEPLPSKFSSVKPYATEYTLACVQLPKDPDDRDTSLKALAADIQNEPIMLNVESRGTPPEVTLYDAQQNDIIKNLLLDGLLTVPKRRDRRLFKLINEYRAAQDVAKNNHISIWRYGDITEDDA